MTKQMKISNKSALIIVLAIIIGVPVACGIIGSHLSSSSSSQTTSGTMPSSGDNAVFSQTDSNLITTTQGEFDKLQSFAQKNNQTAIQNMLNDGEASLIPVGTHVEVIKTNWDGSADIQIVDGDLQGKEVYTFLNALSKTN
jgi:hypothetical protein